MTKLVDVLQSGPAAYALGPVASVVKTLRRRSLTIIGRDRDGDWFNRQRRGTFFNPLYNSVSYDDIERLVEDAWCFQHPVGKGDVVVDIGAGVGDEVVVLSRLVGETGKVVAIEAHPRTFRCLQKTVAANGLQNVEALQLAVSDHDRGVMISDRAHHISNKIGGANGIKVPTKTLDAVLQDLSLERPTLVKMNIEGAETGALRGSAKTLGLVPHWLIHCHDFIADQTGEEAMRTSKDVTDILKNAGLETFGDRRDSRPWVRNFVYGRRPA